MSPYTLRPNWRAAFGPLDLKMPVDPAPSLIDWDAVDANKLAAQHEDSEDCHNTDGTWGPKNEDGTLKVGAHGGSGINFGYSCDDLAAVVVAEKACYARPQKYDWEHWIRQIRYSIAAWEMTHERLFARRCMVYDSMATSVLNMDPATIHLDDQGWVPFTLAQFNAMAKQKPHVGLPGPQWNARAVGWIGHGRAMRHKVEAALSPAWANMLIETCELAAIPGTGQLVVDDDYGRHNPPVQYSFHWAILAHAVMALCYRLRRPVPTWVIEGMNALDAVAAQYGGKIPSYCYTVGGVLVPEISEVQHPDPGQAYWSHNCVALEKLRPGEGWLQRAPKYGPTQALDEQSKKDSMLLRGALAP